MPTLAWLVVFCILSLICVLGGYRDLVGFLRIGPSKGRRYVTWLLLVLWLAGLGAFYYFWWADSPGFYINGNFWAGVLGFSLCMFLLMSLSGTLRRSGPGRTYAIAWTTFREATSQRAWLAVPIWLVGVLVVGIFVSPYRLVQDRMMLSTELLVRGQLLVAGILILALACRSIPQELLKQTIVVTASKPINRLELVMGKLLGFILLGGLLVGMMGLLSYAILWHHGQQVQKQARRELQIQEEEYQAGLRTIRPDVDLEDIAQNGVLYARDSVYPSRAVDFNGKFDPFFNTVACLKGGSEASIEWRFDEIPVIDRRWPWLVFNFGIERVPEEIVDKENFDPKAPLKIKVLGISLLDPRQFRVEEELELPVPEASQGADMSRPVGFGTRAALPLASSGWYELYNRGPVVIRLTFGAAGHYLYFRNESIQLRNLSPDRPGALGQTTMFPPAHGRGVVVGRKFRNSYEIAGTEVGEPEVAYWHFKNVDLSKFGPGEDVRFEIQTYREKSEVVQSHTVGLVRAMAVKPDGTMTFWPGSEDEGPKGEKLLARDWPGWQQVVMQERQPTALKLPRKLFTKNTDVYVFLACGTPKGWIALGDKSGYLSRDRRSFAGNVLRCETIVLLQVVSIAAVSVMASSFLSWPVACFLSLTIYLIGSVRGYLAEMAQFWGRLSGTLVGYTIEGLTTVFPNFASYRASEYIAKGELIATDKLSELFIHTSLCMVVMLMLAYLLLRSRELAK